MKPAPFAYAKARSLDDAIRLIGEHKGEAKLLAGGQSLIATLNMRLSSPSLLVDINGVAGLDGISRQKRHGRDRRAGAPCHAGALFRHRETCAADRARDAAHRASGDPQSRHHRRLDRLCGSRSRIARVSRGARWRDRYRRAEGQAHREGRRFLQGPVRDGARTARRAECDPPAGCDSGHAGRLRGAGAPAWRLRAGRAGGRRKGERQGA